MAETPSPNQETQAPAAGNERLSPQAAAEMIERLTQQAVAAVMQLTTPGTIPQTAPGTGLEDASTEQPNPTVEDISLPPTTDTSAPHRIRFSQTEDDDRLQELVTAIVPNIQQWLKNQDFQPEEDEIVEHIREVLRRGDEYVDEWDQALVVSDVLGNLPLRQEQEDVISTPVEGVTATITSDQPNYFTAPRGEAMRQLCERVLAQIRPRFGPEAVFDIGTLRRAITQYWITRMPH